MTLPAFLLGTNNPAPESFINEDGQAVAVMTTPSSAVSGGASPSVTWRVGGTGTNDTYGTFAAALAALAPLGGSFSTMRLDPSGGALVIPAGAYDLTGVALVGGASGTTSIVAVAVAAGVTFTHPPAAMRYLALDNSAATGPVCTLATPSVLSIVELGPLFILEASAHPFFAVTGASSAIALFATTDVVLGFPFVTVAAAASAFVLGSSAVEMVANAFQGAGVVQFDLDHTCLVLRPDPLTFTGTFSVLWDFTGLQVESFVVESGSTGAVGPVVWEHLGDLCDALTSGTERNGVCVAVVGDSTTSLAGRAEGAVYSVSNAQGYCLELRARTPGQVLELADGFQFASGGDTAPTLRLSGGLQVRWQATTVSPWVPAGNKGDNLYLGEGASIAPSTVIAPTLPFGFVQSSGAGPLLVRMSDQSTIAGDGTGAVAGLRLQGGRAVTLVLEGGAALEARALTGPDSATAIVSDSGTFVGGQPDLAAFTITNTTTAARENYTPAVPGNWPTPPTQVAQALDELAALPASGLAALVLANNVRTAIGGPQPPANPAVITAPPITPTPTAPGHFMVTVSMPLGAMTAGDPLTFSTFRDGVFQAFAPNGVVAADALGHAFVSWSWLDTGAGPGAHTYEARCQDGGAGTPQIQGTVTISVQETL